MQHDGANQIERDYEFSPLSSMTFRERITPSELEVASLRAMYIISLN